MLLSIPVEFTHGVFVLVIVIIIIIIYWIANPKWENLMPKTRRTQQEDSPVRKRKFRKNMKRTKILTWKNLVKQIKIQQDAKIFLN